EVYRWQNGVQVRIGPQPLCDLRATLLVTQTVAHPGELGGCNQPIIDVVVGPGKPSVGVWFEDRSGRVMVPGLDVHCSQCGLRVSPDPSEARRDRHDLLEELSRTPLCTAYAELLAQRCRPHLRALSQ